MNKTYKIYHITSDRRVNYEAHQEAQSGMKAVDKFVEEHPQMISERDYLIAIETDEFVYPVGARVNLF